VQETVCTDVNDLYIVWSVFAQGVVFLGSWWSHLCWNF